MAVLVQAGKLWKRWDYNTWLVPFCLKDRDHIVNKFFEDIRGRYDHFAPQVEPSITLEWQGGCAIELLVSNRAIAK